MAPVIGYIHDLSRIRQGPKNASGFNMKLQTASGRVRDVCFSKDEYNIFAEKEKTITLAKISNYVTLTSLDGLKEEILINDMSIVQTPASSEYSFQYDNDGKGNTITCCVLFLRKRKVAAMSMLKEK